MGNDQAKGAKKENKEEKLANAGSPSNTTVAQTGSKTADSAERNQTPPQVDSPGGKEAERTSRSASGMRMTVDSPTGASQEVGTLPQNTQEEKRSPSPQQSLHSSLHLHSEQHSHSSADYHDSKEEQSDYEASSAGGHRSSRQSQRRSHASKVTAGSASMASPSDMESIARALNIDLSHEVYLVPLVHDISAAGLPPGWRRQLCDSGSIAMTKHTGTDRVRSVGPLSGSSAGPVLVTYVQDGEGRFSSQRPVPESTNDRVQEVRKAYFARAVDAAEPSPWLEFSTSRGTRYYYNFKTRTSSSHIPDPAHPALGVDTLRFKSWWTVHGSRQYMTIAYKLHECVFHVQIDHDDNTYIVSELSNHGIDVTALDLYVGAKLSVLGRTVTLQQCNHTTKCWIEENVKRVNRIQALLETQVKKYHSKPLVGRYHSTSTKSETNLRALLMDVALLRDVLRSYRPSVADTSKYRAKLLW